MTPSPSRRACRFWPTLLVIALGSPALLVAGAAGGAGTAWAQTTPLTAEQKQEMKQHYERGQRAFDVGKYADAIEEYARVYEMSGNPAMLFNIAQAHRLANQGSEAIRFYRRYLQRAPNAPNRADVEQKIAELEKAGDGRSAPPAPAAAVPLTPAPPATPPAPAPAAAPVPPPPPPPAPVVVAPPPSTTGSTSTTSPIEPAPVIPPAAPGPPTSTTSAAGNARLWGVISLMVVGAGGMVLAGFEGLAASSKADTITAQSRAGKVFDPAVETSGRRENAIAITSAIVGGAALITAGVLLFTGPHPPSGGESPTSTGGGVTLAPWIAPGPSALVGAGASWHY